MEEWYDFRILEKYAYSLFGDKFGSKMGIVRKVMLPSGDPKLIDLRILVESLAYNDESAFFGWSIERKYKQNELDLAIANRAIITTAFEPTGEQCGTVYDYSHACSVCGAGRRQVSDLILDIRRIPKNKDISRTIAEEWIISQRFAEVLLDINATGFNLQPVHHKSYFGEGDSYSFREVQSGRDLIAAFEKEYPGVEISSVRFRIWLNKTINKNLLHKFMAELSSYHAKKHTNMSLFSPNFYQLIVTSPGVPISQSTVFGKNPFDLDITGKFRCPRGHVAGLRVISEVFAKKTSLCYDIMQSQELVGLRVGVFVPSPILIFSARLSKLFRTSGLKGLSFEMIKSDVVQPDDHRFME